eukprot:3291415-Pleurochrysis_carterae.AAC.2
MEPRIFDIVLASTMNDQVAAARKAARLVRGDDAAAGDPTRAHHAITNIFEEGLKDMDSVIHEKMNITEEMAADDAKKVKAMRTSVGWFSSPSCALI